jgi:uncharacterized protein
MRIFLVCISVVLVISSVNSQTFKTDLELLKNSNFENQYFNKKKVSYLFKESNRKIVKYNPVSLFFGGLMLFYQSSISPQFSAHCLYSTSCSEFSKKLILRYGFIKGIFMTADRLTRCNSFSVRDISPLKRNTASGKVVESVDVYKNRKKDYYIIK